MMRKLWIIVILWLLISRILLMLLISSDPDRGRIVDSDGYIGLATWLVEEKNYLPPDNQDINWPPGYPVFMLIVSGFQSPSLLAIIFAQILMNVVTVAVIYQLGKLAFGDRIAIGAVIVLSLSPNALFWSAVVMSETLFGFILIISLLLLTQAIRRGNHSLLFCAGFGLGLGAMVRPIGLPLILIWALVILIFRTRSVGLRRGVLQSLVLVAGVALLVVPWTFRNGIRHGEFVFSKVSGMTFFNFNVADVLSSIEGVERNEASELIVSVDDPLSRTVQIAIKYPGVFIKQQVLGITRAAFGIESGVWGKLLGYGLEGRGSFGVITALTEGGVKAAYTQLLDQWSSEERQLHLILGIIGMAFTVLLAAFSIVGMMVYNQLDPLGRLVLGIVVWTVAYLIIVPGAAGQARFRIPAEPLLALLGAQGISLVVERIRRSQTFGKLIRA